MKVEISNVGKKYGKVKALNGFSLTMETGIYGILGPNGAGKSTLIKILIGNEEQTTGEIFCNGYDIRELGSVYRRQIGYMPQEIVCYSGFTAQKYLEYIAALKGMEVRKKQVQEEIRDLLQEVHLYEKRNVKIGGFSGGMKRRIMLAQALLGSPKILVLDEPSAGLDPKERIAMRNLIAKMSLDRLILLATHIVSDIECIADYVILMNSGKVIECQKPEMLLGKLEGKVAEITCAKEDLIKYQQRYPSNNVYQGKEGFVLHVVGNEFPKEAKTENININLEDVYLYYFG